MNRAVSHFRSGSKSLALGLTMTIGPPAPSSAANLFELGGRWRELILRRRARRPTGVDLRSGNFPSGSSTGSRNAASTSSVYNDAMCRCGLYCTRCVIRLPRYGSSPVNRCSPTRVRAPDRNVKTAEAREKNSMSITVSIRRDRAAASARRKSMTNVCSRPSRIVDHVRRRDDAEDVEDRAVAFEDAEEDVVPADAGGRARDRILREHRRALLDELEEEDSLGPGRSLRQDRAHQRQQRAERHAEPIV